MMNESIPFEPARHEGFIYCSLLHCKAVNDVSREFGLDQPNDSKAGIVAFKNMTMRIVHAPRLAWENSLSAGIYEGEEDFLAEVVNLDLITVKPSTGT